MSEDRDLEKTSNNEENISFLSEIKEWIKIIIVSFLVALIVTSFIKPTLVIGHSMDHTLSDKDYLLVNRMAYIGESAPEYKDIIVFNTDLPSHNILIKRVIGEEGDRVQIKNGKVYINEKLLNENYIGGQETVGDIDLIVPKEKIFAMGDNRNNSLDSRSNKVGLVAESQIIGKIMLRVFPFERIED